MEIILPLAMVALTIFVIARTGVLSPASINCIFSTLSIAVFCYIVYGGGMDAPPADGLSFAIGDYHQQAPIVIQTYFLLVLVTAVSTLGLSRKRDAVSKDTGNYILALMDRFLFSSAMPIIATTLFVATILSFLLSAVGAWNSPLVQVVNMGLGPGTVFYVCLLIYSWGKQSKLVTGMLLFLFVYNSLFMLAFYSRFTALTWFVAAGLIAAKRITAKKSAFSASVFGCIFLGFWMFLYALQGRGSRGGKGLGIFNWPVIANHLFGINLDSTILISISTNIFAGPMILAECLGTGSVVSYDPNYMNFSFSPLPAFLDGWRSIGGGVHFANAATPFNSLAELYYFGWPYIILFGVLLAICIRVLTRIYMQIGGAGGLLLTSPCVYSLLSLHQYPLRNSLRLMYATTLIVYFVSKYLNKQVMKTGAGRRIAGAVPPHSLRSSRLPATALSGTKNSS